MEKYFVKLVAKVYHETVIEASNQFEAEAKAAKIDVGDDEIPEDLWEVEEVNEIAEALHKH